jgi:cytochrome c-type biogenesis protein CcmH
MIAFSAACAAFVVAVLMIIVRPLRVTSRSQQTGTHNDAVVAVYRRQLAELEADRRHGLVADDQFLSERDDLEQRVIADLGEASHSKGTARPTVHPGGLTYVIAIGLPLAAALLYLVIGAPDVILNAR